jgi:hypothetical protein
MSDYIIVYDGDYQIKVEFDENMIFIEKIDWIKGSCVCQRINRRKKMKLPIKKKYFEMIKSGKKNVEYRDAHITFVCEESGETLTKDVLSVSISKDIKSLHPDVLEDENTICFVLGGN